MNKTNKLNINLGNLNHQEIGYIDRENISIIPDNPYKEFEISKEIKGYVDIIKIDDQQIEIDYNLNTKINLDCARCLKKITYPIKIIFSQEYKNKKNINILPEILQEIILKIPIKPLCDINCSGVRGYKIRKENHG